MDIRILALLILMVPSFTVQNGQLTDLVKLTPNTLTQARFFQLRRKPLNKTTLEKIKNGFRKDHIRVICGENTMGLSIRKAFSGRIFASHQEKNRNCVKYVTKSSSPVMFSVNFNGTCGVQTATMKSAVEHRLRVVVSLDYEQMTEEDVIYDVTCRYNSMNVSLETYYDISGFHPQNIMNTSVIPQCKYSLHRDQTENVSTVAASVGDVIYHRWKCTSKDYLFKVYRCFVHNGMDKSYMIVDDKGCSLDEEILPHPQYDFNIGLASTSAKAFRFAKTRRVHFNCLVALCHKDDESCAQDIPPKCNRSQHKRHLPSNIPIEERLMRIHRLLSGKDSSTITMMKPISPTSNVISVSSDDVDIDDNEQMMVEQKYCDCENTSMSWIYLLCFSNIISLILMFLAFYKILQNRYCIEISHAKRHLSSTFQF